MTESLRSSSSLVSVRQAPFLRVDFTDVYPLVQVLQIKEAQGSNEASDITDQQTLLTKDIATDVASAGQGSTGVA